MRCLRAVIWRSYGRATMAFTTCLGVLGLGLGLGVLVTLVTLVLLVTLVTLVLLVLHT